MKHRKLVLGIDVGGTKIKWGVVSSGGDVRLFREVPTVKTRKHFQDLLRAIRQELHEKNVHIVGVGIGMPGMVDFRSGKMRYLPHLSMLRGFSIGKEVRQIFRRACFLDNDAHCALFSKLYFNPSFQQKTVVMLTLGTGTGSAIAIHGRLFSGSPFSVAGLGEMVIDPEGEICTCGRRGCLNAYTGARAIERITYEKIGEKLSQKELIERMTQGDPLAKEVVTYIGRHMGLALANIYNIFHPDLLIISGNAASMWSVLQAPALAELRNKLFGNVKIPLRIRVSRTKGKDGVIGADALVLSGRSPRRFLFSQ